MDQCCALREEGQQHLRRDTESTPGPPNLGLCWSEHRRTLQRTPVPGLSAEKPKLFRHPVDLTGRHAILALKVPNLLILSVSAMAQTSPEATSSTATIKTETDGAEVSVFIDGDKKLCIRSSDLEAIGEQLRGKK